MKTHNCHRNAECINIPNAFQCDCKIGYTGNGVHCKNINECIENSDDCPYDSVCTDTEGSFTCECSPGFQNVPQFSGEMVCENIDECATQSDSLHCVSNSTCIDTRSGFEGMFRNSPGITVLEYWSLKKVGSKNKKVYESILKRDVFVRMR